MTPEQLERVIAGIRSVHGTTGHEGVAALAMAAGKAKVEGSDSFGGTVFDFVQQFDLWRVLVPPQNLDEAMPGTWTVGRLDPYFQKIKDAAEAKSDAAVEPPEDLSSEELMEAWRSLRLFIDSGAVLRQNTEHNKQTARLRIQERGLSSILVVLDEQYRVIYGLPELWALSEMDGYETAPAVILHDAPSDAGWLHTHAEALKWGQTLWKKDEIQGVLTSSTIAEREFFQSFGFHQVPETTVLTLTWDTFDQLAVLITKQLGSNTKHDPAQLLFVEALREAVLTARQRIIDAGKSKPGDADKLERHLQREAEMLAEGQRIEKENGWEWREDESELWSHPALPKYRFKIVEPEPSAVEPAPAPSERPAQTDPHLKSLSQFQLLARDHFGMDADEAAGIYGAESFNQLLRSYVAKTPWVARRGPSEPGDEVRRNQAERLALWNSR